MKVKHVWRLFALFALLIFGAKAIFLLLSPNTYSSETLMPDQTADVVADINFSATSDKNNFLLFWGIRWGSEPWPPEGYQMDECIVTYDRSKVWEAKALVIHSTTLKPSDFPWKWPRRQDQLYIWWNSETPAAVFRETPRWTMKPYVENFFNWTMTYRTSADVVWNYGYRGDLINDLPLGKAAVDRIVANKNNIAVIVMSNCKSKRRMDYLTKLFERGLKVTYFGKCFNNLVSKKNMDETIRLHKFYLAFENAHHCHDYITEKFWDNALKNGAVPVVLGPLKEDLLKVAPLNSFIFAEDFATPEKLAEYLLYLDQNDNEYRKYFAWREDESMTDSKMIDLVKKSYPNITPQTRPQRLCERILTNKKTKIIKSLIEVILSNDPTECLES